VTNLSVDAAFQNSYPSNRRKEPSNLRSNHIGSRRHGSIKRTATKYDDDPADNGSVLQSISELHRACRFYAHVEQQKGRHTRAHITAHRQPSANHLRFYGTYAPALSCHTRTMQPRNSSFWSPRLKGPDDPSTMVWRGERHAGLNALRHHEECQPWSRLMRVRYDRASASTPIEKHAYNPQCIHKT